MTWSWHLVAYPAVILVTALVTALLTKGLIKFSRCPICNETAVFEQIAFRCERCWKVHEEYIL